jgi:hypothetical protein
MLIQKLKEYLKGLLKQEFLITPLPKNAINGLPLYLSKTYKPFHFELFGKELILFEVIGRGIGTPSRMAKDLNHLQRQFGMNSVFVLEYLASWQRGRLIEQGVPFIVPGRQMFLPMLLIDLREYFPTNTLKEPTNLSWTSQLTVIRQILFMDVGDRPMTEVASVLGYSPMTMTKVRQEVSGLGLCEERIKGRERHFQFTLDPEQLWNASKPYLRSPVLNRHPVFGMDKESLTASVNALSWRSSIQADSEICVAVHSRRFRNLLQSGIIIKIEDEDRADAIIEEWQYDPHKLSNTETVDPLSLYLSLTHDPDERIQIALDEMMENLLWLKD